jgi:hypothetical protein
MKKIITTILLVLLCSGCLNPKKNITPSEPVTKEPVIEKNKSLCMLETGIKSSDALAIKETANKFAAYLVNQKYEDIQPFLTRQYQKILEDKGIKESNLDVFLPGASQIAKAIGNFSIKYFYKIETNPESTEVQGICMKEPGNTQNIAYNVINPQPEMAAVFISGVKGSTFANAILLLVKKETAWEINYATVYPGGAGGQTTAELYQYARKYHQEGRLNVAYLLYKLILDISPRGTLVPEFIISSQEAVNSMGVILPDKELQKYEEWQVADDLILPVYELKTMPVQDSIVLFAGYITETEDTNFNDVESQLLTKYIKRRYPDLAYYFTLLITEATFEVPQTEDYLHYSKLQKL